MSLLLRALLYALCLYLVMVVYTSQRHSEVVPTLRSALRMTGKLYLWSVVAVVVMFCLEWLFIDR